MTERPKELPSTTWTDLPSLMNQFGLLEQEKSLLVKLPRVFMLSTVTFLKRCMVNNRLQESETKLNEITKDQDMNAKNLVALMRQNKNFLELFKLYAFVLRNGFHSYFHSLFCVVLFLAPLQKPTIHQLVIKQGAIKDLPDCMDESLLLLEPYIVTTQFPHSSRILHHFGEKHY